MSKPRKNTDVPVKTGIKVYRVVTRNAMKLPEVIRELGKFVILEKEILIPEGSFIKICWVPSEGFYLVSYTGHTLAVASNNLFVGLGLAHKSILAKEKK